MILTYLIGALIIAIGISVNRNKWVNYSLAGTYLLL